ncbi:MULTISPECIES: HigA family addiction module antitoxin [Veillonella]|uniref:Addiction module antidote protein, HigA family n=1 Tax=Veillonella denticariosi JCM 15641 TaxID=1298594 RepID=A0A2S7ZB39_9FIRM|nr:MULTISPECIES: HigA family addiction module antitoxin [Veillonella]ETS92144.1 addiction module antidote protein HigA [Veillonella sp. AS16]PQL20337.1 addiction module antidote protein, HigA family [Veillonella denticariosi JCM 15641]
MSELIPVPKMSEVLLEEFMRPLGLSTYRVAKDIKVPVSRIQEILQNKRKITADTDLRLCKYFGMSNGFFLRMQMDLDLLEAKDMVNLQADLKEITCVANQSVDN